MCNLGLMTMFIVAYDILFLFNANYFAGVIFWFPESASDSFDLWKLNCKDNLICIQNWVGLILIFWHLVVFTVLWTIWLETNHILFILTECVQAFTRLRLEILKNVSGFTIGLLQGFIGKLNLYRLAFGDKDVIFWHICFNENLVVHIRLVYL